MPEGHQTSSTSTIRILPSEHLCKVTNGTSLIDVLGLAGVSLEIPCGGEGACGECRIRVQSGSVETLSRGCLTQQEQSEGWALACSSRVCGDVTLLIPEEEDLAKAYSGQDKDYPEKTTASSEPIVRKAVVTIEPASEDNSFSDLERLLLAVKRSSLSDVRTCSLQVLRQLAQQMRADPEHTTLAVETHGKIIQIEAGNSEARNFGLAIDVGTTTCAVQLVDLAQNQILGTSTSFNGQIPRGQDIISRINYARTAAHLDELRILVLTTLNDHILSLVERHRVSVKDVLSIVVSGNTTMMHLLLGLPPEYIRLAPYTPTVNYPPELTARDVGITAHPEAVVTFAPGVGSYVGGDITAGLLQTKLANEGDENLSLFLDIGTNGEVVIGNSEWLMTCAASAGPAFEGVGVGCGMRAVSGAIERLQIDPGSGNVDYTVIGGDAPRGICGSGLVDLLAAMLRSGCIDVSGKLVEKRSRDRILPSSDGTRNNTFLVVNASETVNGEDILIDERDIQNLLRTKAAIYSAVSLMSKAAGTQLPEIDQVYVAGGFGRFLDLENSIQIGLLPDLPRERFIYLGNSSLKGASTMLRNESARVKVHELASRMTYLELNVDPAYMDEYVSALFLPHTDLNRFPSVRRPPHD